MPYCSKCGTEIPENAKFCSKCGTAVSAPPARSPQKTAIDIIGTDKQLQEHWIKRLFAIIIDGIAISIVTWILLTIILFPIVISAIMTRNFSNPIFTWYSSWLLFPLIVGVLSVLYFPLTESIYGQTLGKRIIGLKVTTIDGQTPSLEKTFIRNLSKIYWVLLLLDVFGGLITQGDPHQKYSDRVAGTTITTIA